MVRRVIGLAALLAVLAVTPASAVVLGLDWGIGVSPVKVNYNGSNMNLWVGALDAYLGGSLGNPLPPNDGTYIGHTFCVDLDHLINVPTEYEVEVMTTSSLANGGRAAWLFRNFGTSLASSQDAAALQLAIWDVIVDNGDGLSAGSFKYVSGLSGAATSDAGTMLGLSLGKSDVATYFKPTNGGQAMLGTPPVPEPATLGLLALGLVAMAPLALRRRNRNQ